MFDNRWLLAALAARGMGAATRGFGLLGPAMVGGGDGRPAAGDEMPTGTAGMGGGTAAAFGPTNAQQGFASIAEPQQTPMLTAGLLGAGNSFDAPTGAAFDQSQLGMPELAAPTSTQPSMWARAQGFMKSDKFANVMRAAAYANAATPKPSPLPPAQRPPGMAYQAPPAPPPRTNNKLAMSADELAAYRRKMSAAEYLCI